MTALDLVTLKALNDETGLDLRTIRAAVEGAGLHRYAGNRYEHEPALAAIAANTDAARVEGHRAVGRGAKAAVGVSDLSHQRARQAAAAADRLETENAKRKGDLILRESVEKAITDIVARARTHFLGMGPRVAARLAGMEDEQAIIALLDAEARITLRELARLDDLHAAVLA